MAAIRHSLQRDLFKGNDERLVFVVHVTKPSKKKKSSFLCVATSIDQPVDVSIYQVKKSEKDNKFKKRDRWRLRELKTVDGKDAARDTAEFDLLFDRVYKWVASSVQDKNAFISCLWKLCARHLRQAKPNFRNVSKDILEESLLLGSGDTIIKTIIDEDAPFGTEEDYQALTEREECDLERLMSQCEFAIGNAEAFTERLSKDLSILDGANIHTIMASEDQVQRLMDMIQVAIDEAAKIEKRLDGYDDTLKNVRETMEKIEEKNILIQVQNSNSLKLYEELETLVGQLDFKHEYQMMLLDSDLTNPAKVIECAEAAQALHDAMNTKCSPCLLKMAAVLEQHRLFEKLRAKFTQRLSRHLNNLFIHLGNEMGENLSVYAPELTLPKHVAVHRELAPYSKLMQWLKATDVSIYSQLASVYIDSLCKLYEREIHEFFEGAKQKMMGRTERDRRGGGRGIESTQDLPTKVSLKVRSTSLLGVDRESSGSDLDLNDRSKFDKLFEQMLSELEPVCLAEQQFCARFFHLASDAATSQVVSRGSGAECGSNLVRTASEESVLTGEQLSNNQKKEKLVNDELKQMMMKLFSTLEQELLQLISHFDRMDSFYSMYILVRLSQHVMAPQYADSFVSKIFANCLVHAKRNFDKFVSLQSRSITESKISKKSKCGILQFVIQFEEFAQQAGVIFHGSERNNYLDKCYINLVEAMFKAIPRIAVEQNKTPQEVVMMENFHHLYALLSQLKISSLDSLRKEAKQKYSDSLQSYVTRYFGRPLEKLNNFFEGVQAKVAQGVKEEEIGYQLVFSKQELRKVIKEYPGKEVKRGLENLYKKVEKHLCEEENLLQVVWRSMQEEFIRQYKYIQELIERCYPGSMITLEFSIEDILQFFSDIARSH